MRQINPFISGYTLEVGAGIGNNTIYLIRSRLPKLYLIEPDSNFTNELIKRFSNEISQDMLSVYNKYLFEIKDLFNFDTILYINVLEHIENDKEEVQTAISMLRKNGHLIIVSPSHNFLYSPFDKAIGHFRRYHKGALEALFPRNKGTIEALYYLDSVGLIASLANKLFIHYPLPTLNQILFWDRFIVPFSRLLDPILKYRIGKSILIVWKNN